MPRHGLRQVVGAEAEELGGLGDFVRGQSAARHFDHRADEVVELHFLFRHDFLGDAMDDFDLQVEFLLEADQRDHDFRLHFDALLSALRPRLRKPRAPASRRFPDTRCPGGSRGSRASG